MNDSAHEWRQRLTGIALMCGAVACFACLDATAKYLNQFMSTAEVAWARYAAAFVIALIPSNPMTRPGLVRTNRIWLQIARSALLLGSTICNFFAICWLQLDQALAIMFSVPIMVAVLSGPLLGEQLHWRRWTAIGVGFCGVLVVTRPGFGGIHPAALISLLAAGCLSLYSITTRMLAATDSSETTLFYSNLVGTVALIPFLPLVWTTPNDPFHLALMVEMGVLASGGHYLLIAGHRLAPASLLSPFIYTQLVWVLIVSYLVFGNLPNTWTVAGAAIVIGSGLYILHRERMRGQIKPPAITDAA